MTTRLAVAVIAAMLFAPVSLSAATITIAGGDGFNDPTVINESDGFPAGTTLGQKRMAVFQAAAAIWGARLQSNVTIVVSAEFVPQDCQPLSAQLGSAGARTFLANFPNAPRTNTFYPIALANALAGTDRNGANPEIDAQFNSNLDSAMPCFLGGNWWYSITNNAPPNRTALLPTVLHEMGHGLGFASLACDDPSGCVSVPYGGYFNNIPDIWAHFQFDRDAGLFWVAMTNAQRAASTTNDPDLVWNGANVNAAIPTFQPGGVGTSGGFIRLYAPTPVEPGSSVSHFTDAALPNLLMEPSATDDVFNTVDMTPALFADIGWVLSSTPPAGQIFANGFE